MMTMVTMYLIVFFMELILFTESDIIVYDIFGDQFNSHRHFLGKVPFAFEVLIGINSSGIGHDFGKLHGGGNNLSIFDGFNNFGCPVKAKDFYLVGLAR